MEKSCESCKYSARYNNGIPCNTKNIRCNCEYSGWEPIINNKPDEDKVNHPSHYTGGEIECIDAIKEATKGLEGIQAHCTGCAIKYLWRWKKKNGVEDLKKANWYLNKLIGELESNGK